MQGRKVLTGLQGRWKMMISQGDIDMIKSLVNEAILVLKLTKCDVKDDAYLELLACNISELINNVKDDEIINDIIGESGILGFIKEGVKQNEMKWKEFSFRLLHEMCPDVQECLAISKDVLKNPDVDCKSEIDLISKVLEIGGFERLGSFEFWKKLQSLISPSKDSFWIRSLGKLMFVLVKRTTLDKDYRVLCDLFDLAVVPRKRDYNGCFQSRVTSDVYQFVINNYLDHLIRSSSPVSSLEHIFTQKLTLRLSSVVKVKMMFLIKDYAGIQEVLDSSENDHKTLKFVIKHQPTKVCLSKCFNFNLDDKNLKSKIYGLVGTKSKEITRNIFNLIELMKKTEDNFSVDHKWVEIINGCLSYIKSSPERLTMDRIKILSEISTSRQLPINIKSMALEAIKTSLETSSEAKDLNIKDIMVLLWNHALFSADWKVKELFYAIISLLFLKDSIKHDVSLSIISDLIKSGLDHKNPFIRATTLSLIASTKDLIPPNLQHLLQILKEDTEAIVRREVIKTMSLLVQSDPELEFQAFHTVARKDLDWEVRELALAHWELKLDVFIDSLEPGIDYQSLHFRFRDSHLSKALEVNKEDFDEQRRLQKLYFCQKKLKEFLVSKFNNEIRSLSSITVDLSLPSTSACSISSDQDCDFNTCLANPEMKTDNCLRLCPFAKLVFASLAEDLDEKRHQFEEHHGVVQRLTSVLEDIIQSQKPENEIDLIDCF